MCGPGPSEATLRRMDAPIVLVQPPVCDPYAPLLGVPALSAVLKKAGATCICLDLNLELHLAAATPRGVELLRRDAEAEQTRLQDAFGPDALVPGHVRSSLGRSLLERPDLADELAAAQDALRRPELYRFGNDGKLKLTEQVGVYHGLAGLLAIPPAPFSAKRALDLADGREPLPYRSWLIEEAVPRIVSQEPAWVGISVTFEQQLLPALLAQAFGVAPEVADRHVVLVEAALPRGQCRSTRAVRHVPR